MAKGRPPDPGRQRRKRGHQPPSGTSAATMAKPVLVVEEPGQWPAPSSLPAGVVDLWQDCVTEMAATRRLRKPDLVLLKAYCEAVDLHDRASENIHHYGVLVKGLNGPVANPLIRVQKDAASTMRQLSDVLGINPLARIPAGLAQLAGQTLMKDLHTGMAKAIVAQIAARK
jgi:P27 family predicted phage terminase small subunit